jgi:hypothetical protein
MCLPKGFSSWNRSSILGTHIFFVPTDLGAPRDEAQVLFGHQDWMNKNLGQKLECWAIGHLTLQSIWPNGHTPKICQVLFCLIACGVSPFENGLHAVTNQNNVKKTCRSTLVASYNLAKFNTLRKVHEFAHLNYKSHFDTLHWVCECVHPNF